MSAGRKEFSLLELNARVRDALQEALPERYWVRAEVSEARIHPSGHCYLELIEKEESTGRTVAKARATIWATTFRLLRPWFEQSTGQLFTSGIFFRYGKKQSSISRKSANECSSRNFFATVMGLSLPDPILLFISS